MKSGEWRLAAIGITLLGAGAVGTRLSQGAMRDAVLPGGCRTPVRVLAPRAPQAVGSAVVFHGLSTSGRMMQTLGQWLAALGLQVYLVDSPGHGGSDEPFSFPRAEECAADLVDSLARRSEIDLGRTVLVGHSMGGSIAIRLADRFPTAATIAISPAPMVRPAGLPPILVPYELPRRMPINLLVFVGGWEPRWADEAAQALMRAAGGERLQPEDFQQRRAAKMVLIPRATHTSLLFDRRVEDWSVDWARNALNFKAAERITTPGYPVLGGILGIVGLSLLYPLAASASITLLRAQSSEAAAIPPSPRRILLTWVPPALMAVVVLKFWVPLRALRLWTGDYLASFFLLAGVLLLALLWRASHAALRFNLRAIAGACVLGFATILAFGAWLNWQLDDVWMNATRWLRFAPVVAASLPYFAAEELALGAPNASQRWRRWGMFLLLRLILWLALMSALLVLWSGQILILLLAIFLLAFSIVQRAAADAVYRRTGSVAAAATLDAILAGWFIAAVFPLT